MRTAITVLVLLVTAAPAAAWDGPELWYDRADAASPGGGGIFGTGGLRDHRVTCSHCHVDRVENGVTLDLRFQPALGSAGGEATFQAGQRYRIDVSLVGETLGSICDPYMMNMNGFAVAFENDGGAIVGTLESDSGQIQSNCPTNFTDPPSGTTALYRDCQTVFSIAPEDVAAWTFYWTAPATGGTVRMYYGGVDGDCTMSSRGDGVVAGRRTLIGASAQSASPAPGRGPGSGAIGLVGLAVLAGLGAPRMMRLRRREHDLRAPP